ncbi:hypothetical protein [Sporosarcina sp. USHLN248]|uniref:hypothetical protein n=1 Tax=Sporosarcina sp. USHLN248 TaxID=3081300 RepID=UPI00301753E2
MFMWDIWPVPIGIVIIVIGAVCFFSVRSYNRMKVVLNERDQNVPDNVENHPFTMNPILWVIGIAALFILFVIFYYWASSL